MNNTLLPSIIRTFVPIIVGLLSTLALRYGLDLDIDAFTELITALISLGYYAIARVLERKYPNLSILLGSNQQPVDYQSKD